MKRTWNMGRNPSNFILQLYHSMGVGKLQGPSVSVGNLQVVVFVGNLTGYIFLVGKLPPSLFNHSPSGILLASIFAPSAETSPMEPSLSTRPGVAPCMPWWREEAEEDGEDRGLHGKYSTVKKTDKNNRDKQDSGLRSSMRSENL